MFLLFLSLIFTLLAQEATADPVAKSAFPKHGWERGWLAPRDRPLKLHIALRQADDGRDIERQLLAVSDPNSPRYRKYLGAVEAPSLSWPVRDSVHAVEFWLWKWGMLKDATLYGGIFEIDTTVRDAERLLNTTYFMYSDGSREIFRTELYYIPDDVASRIDFVTPTTTFPKPAKTKLSDNSVKQHLKSRKGSPEQVLRQRASCRADDYVTPTCVRQVYDINYNATPNRTTFAVYGTEAASYSSSDLLTYLGRYNAPAASAKADYEVIGSGDSSESSDIASKFETALDTQTALGLAWPAKGMFYNNGGVFGPNAGQTYDPFVQFLQDLINSRHVPSVVSFSESMPEDQLDPAYAKRLCNMMAQVGARGVSLLFSSGDNGPNGDQPTGTHNAIFEPEFPASCPWVTAVGGTTNMQDETAATKSTIDVTGRLSYTASGGGFSNLFSMPGYQIRVGSKYVSRSIPSSYHSVPGFNPNGRGIPDVSAFSTKFATVVDDITFPVSGTSASTPLWAAIVTLLNDYEASKGRSALGFLNPWLYSLRSGLKDITTGGTNEGSCYLVAGCTLSRTLGYNVTAGWDAVTGLGSPIFSELTKALDATADVIEWSSSHSLL